MTNRPLPKAAVATDKQAVAARARTIVMEVERGLRFEPTDREDDKLGYERLRLVSWIVSGSAQKPVPGIEEITSFLSSTTLRAAGNAQNPFLSTTAALAGPGVIYQASRRRT